jgi:hypothetical protein
MECLLDFSEDLSLRCGMCLCYEEGEQEQMPSCVTEIVKSTKQHIEYRPI